MRKFVLRLAIVSALAAILALGFRTHKTSGTFTRQVVTVNPGEYVEVEIEEYLLNYFFGYRLPFMSIERRKIVGVTLHDYNSGKLIGRYHDLGVKICPHCNGVGEVPHAD